MRYVFIWLALSPMGVTREELIELLIQLSIYRGFPVGPERLLGYPQRLRARRPDASGRHARARHAEILRTDWIGATLGSRKARRHPGMPSFEASMTSRRTSGA
jgi:hypothetical protein